MAVRTGAGTGVVVSLVVFILISVLLLVFTVAFSGARSAAQQERDDANRALEQFILPAQRQQDVFQRYVAAAESSRESVAMHMHSRIENIMRYLDGNPGATLEGVQGRLVRYGVPADAVVASTVQSMHTNLRQSAEEIDNLTTQLERANNDLAQAQAQLQSLQESHRQELASVQDQIAGYRQAADEYRNDLSSARQAMDQAVARLEDDFRNRVEALRDENDDFSRQVVSLQDRIEELQERLSADRLRAMDPDRLVDGQIIDLSATDDSVFINRGRNHRIVLGMTFEVYDDAAAIRVNEETGQIPRGKASIQVTRVGDNTSTAKIIRSVPGRPVLRDNVIANAVYDPHYRFKFLVHGRFDIDGDGRPTESEADYVRSMVREWGGEVVLGEEMPGDLDFLVLGVPPEEPPLLPDNPTTFQLEDWARKRQAQSTYNDLLDLARRAQIPVLNHNRFLILTGHTQR